MPEYRIEETVLSVPRDAMLVDTGVLVAAFDPREDAGRQEYARFVLDDYGRPLLVPSVVVVEAWGMLVGSRGARSAGLELLTWLNRPGRATIVPPYRAEVLATQDLIERLLIDIVDALLVELATSITERCALRPALPIATFDTRDFLGMLGKHGLRLSIYDMHTLEEVNLD